MEDLYCILGCPREASRDKLKQAYLSLVKTSHPDKLLSFYQENRDSEESYNQVLDTSQKFIDIHKAWKILGDNELRKQYDIRWKERCIAQDYPVQEDVDIDDFDNANDETMAYPCRCGGHYVITATDAYMQLDFICCDNCTLCVKVIYPSGKSI